VCTKAFVRMLCRNLATKQKYALMDTKRNCSYYSCNPRGPTFTRFHEMLNLKRFKIRRKALVTEALAKGTQCLCEDDQEGLP